MELLPLGRCCYALLLSLQNFWWVFCWTNTVYIKGILIILYKKWYFCRLYLCSIFDNYYRDGEHLRSIPNLQGPPTLGNTSQSFRIENQVVQTTRILPVMDIVMVKIGCTRTLTTVMIFMMMLKKHKLEPNLQSFWFGFLRFTGYTRCDDIMK